MIKQEIIYNRATEFTLPNKFYFEDDIIVDTINSYKNLPIGWDFGEGVPANDNSVKFAIDLYSSATLAGLFTEPHPMTSGGVSLVLHKQGYDHFLTVNINPDLSLDLEYEIGIGINYQIVEEIFNSPKSDLQRLLSKITEECRTQEYLTHLNLTKAKRDSKVTPSRTTMGGFQLSTLRA